MRFQARFYIFNGASISHHVSFSRLEDVIRARSCLASYVKNWNSALLPFVYANDCVELFTYCLLCANRLPRLDAEREISHAIEFDHFTHSFVNANLALIPFWKRIGINWIGRGHIDKFISLYSPVFHVLSRAMLSKASRYL